MRKMFYTWKYMGLNKEDVLAYADTVSCENILFLRAQCLFIWIVTYVVGLGFLMTPGMFRKSAALLVCGSVFMLLYFLIRHAVKNIETIHTSRANRLSNAFAATLFAVACYIGTFASEGGQIAVTVVAVLLFIQVDIDRMPQENLIYSILGFSVFAVCSYLTKAKASFVIDLLDATMSTTLGMFVSWQKSKNKWEYIIAQGKLREINYELYHASMTDELTKLPNRRQAFDCFRKLSQRCTESGSILACIIMDIDQFKLFNDSYGHPEGDRLLEHVGALLLRFSRRNAVHVGRIGGEEFMLFWEESDPERIYALAESLRLSMQSIPHPGSAQGERVTVSIGICACRPGSDFDIEKSYCEADNAMYCAKRSGKNSCWRYYPETENYAPIRKTHSTL